MFKRVGNDKINIMRLFTVLDILKFIWKDIEIIISESFEKYQ